MTTPSRSPRRLVPLRALLLALAVSLAAPSAVCAASIRNHVLARDLDIHMGRVRRAPHRARLSSGARYAVLQASGQLERRAAAQAGGRTAGALGPPSPGSQGCQNVFSRNANTGMLFDNVRVNQDCSLRRQAEEVIAINPKDPLNLIVGQNDSRIGYNRCGFAWSFDGGRTWGDQVPPFYQFALADDHTADVCSDPTVTFDTQGNAYAGGILWDVNAPASALVFVKSNAGIGGAFFHTPAPVPFQTYNVLPLGVVASDNDANVFNDKPLAVADAIPASPKANNIYVAWTRFRMETGAGVKDNSAIFFSQSTDGGATWSPGIEISGANPAVCTVGSGSANCDACDQDQGAQPVVASDGTVYVAFGNSNTPDVGMNQHLVVSCAPAADCSKASSWTTPVKISDDVGQQPLGPDDTTGCADGDQCLPPNGYRLDGLVQGSLAVDNSGRLYFVWADFRNGGADCAAPKTVKTAVPPCDNDVFYSFSKDRGATWSPAFNITPARLFGPSAQWQPWSAVALHGRFLWVAYYDRSYGHCEFEGCNDITLARVRRPASAAPTLTYRRLTTASMPNLLPTNNPVEAGFLGDYMWLTVNAAGDPFVVWADTRSLNGAVEEDVYFALSAASGNNVGR